MSRRTYIPNRILALQIAIILAALVIIAKLFYLQVIKHDDYFAIAQKEHYGYTELPARRGNIMIEDKSTGEDFKLATNATYHTIYVDPKLIAEKEAVNEALAPLLFDLEEERYYDELRVRREIREAKDEEQRQKIRYSSDEELKNAYKNRLLEKISQEIRPQILLYEHLNDEVIKIIEKAELPGIFIKNDNLYAIPKDIASDSQRSKVSQFLSEFIKIEKDDLERILRGINRYVVLRKKIPPQITEQIQAMIAENPTRFKGIGFQEKYYRLYPEKTLAAQILGFVDGQGNGQYGLEGSLNSKLQGKNGVFSSQTDVNGNQITVGDTVIERAIDGDDVYLTIDRAIQLAVERKLKRAVEEYRADSGEVIILDPKTFRIIAMAYYPTFDPNIYGDVFKKKEIKLSPEEIDRLIPLDDRDPPTHFLLYINKDKEEKLEIFLEENEFGEMVYKMFENKVGPLVYRNRGVSDIYEPGSVFKVITMASAINDSDVTPDTTMHESGPIDVDCHTDRVTGQDVCDHKIRNSEDTYRGTLNMTQVLQHSSNIGISFVARRLGRTLLYSYMKNFGFGEKTDIEFDDEHRGQIEFFENWSESELLNHGFGQGIAVTPIQMVSAIATLANGGVLMQPHIIEKIVKENGEVIETEPKAIRQVIKKETADILTSMMTSVVEKGSAPKAKSSTHFLAGKSGTSQTYKNGEPLTGIGTTIASFTGFGPVDDPKFAILVIFNRPRNSEWGGQNAAPLFAEIADFLLDYYNIPPDK